MHSDADNRTDPFKLWKSLDFWQEQSLDLLPLITSLAVIRRMEITGWVAILVYLTIANSSRWLIKYFAAPSCLIGDIKDDYTVNYTVVHAIPQRIRLHVPRISQDMAYGKLLEKLVRADAQVTNVRLNYQVGSIVIAYKSPKTSLSHWVKQLLELARVENSPHPDQSPPGISKIAQKNGYKDLA